MSKSFLVIPFIIFLFASNLYAIKPPFERRTDNIKEVLEQILHNPIYILGYYYSLSPTYDKNLKNEVKYQISFKLPIAREVFIPNGSIFFAYSQTSWFQMYNKIMSRPFRDTDYMPEFFYEIKKIPLNFIADGLKISKISLGYIHVSNGERTDRSRTSNRIMLNYTLAYKNLRLQNKLWFFTSTSGDRGDFIHDNPDLMKYWGYNEILLSYKSDLQIIDIGIQPFIARHYRAKFIAGYTFRVSENIGIYIQYTQGYGDNIYEYDIKSKRVGVGMRYFDF